MNSRIKELEEEIAELRRQEESALDNADAYEREGKQHGREADKLESELEDLKNEENEES